MFNLRGTNETNSSQTMTPTPVMTQPCTLVYADALNTDSTDSSFWGCDLDPADVNEQTGYTVQIDGYDLSSGQDKLGKPIHSGHTKFFAEGTSLIAPGKARVAKKARARFDHQSHRRVAVVTGNKTVLAIRVIAADLQTAGNEDFVSDKIFGTYGDTVNMKTQYAACSNNQLIMNPANKTTTTNFTVLNGVVSTDSSSRRKRYSLWFIVVTAFLTHVHQYCHMMIQFFGVQKGNSHDFSSREGPSCDNC